MCLSIFISIFISFRLPKELVLLKMLVMAKKANLMMRATRVALAPVLDQVTTAMTKVAAGGRGEVEVEVEVTMKNPLSPKLPRSVNVTSCRRILYFFFV